MREITSDVNRDSTEVAWDQKCTFKSNRRHRICVQGFFKYNVVCSSSSSRNSCVQVRTTTSCAMVMMVHEERISVSIDYKFSNVLTVIDDVLNHSYPTTKFTISTLLGRVVGFITSSWILSNSYPQCGCQK
jgi:hypothetical protein